MQISDLYSELKYRSSRSSGSGGQHVNKVETRIELLFDVAASQVLDNQQKNRIQKALSNRINKEGILQIVAQNTRSQVKNRAAALKKFHELIEKALIPPKKRKPVKPLRASREKRLRAKKARSEIKSMRGKVQW